MWVMTGVETPGYCRMSLRDTAFGRQRNAGKALAPDRTFRTPARSSINTEASARCKKAPGALQRFSLERGKPLKRPGWLAAQAHRAEAAVLMKMTADSGSVRARPARRIRGRTLSLSPWKMREPPGKGTGPTSPWPNRDSCRPGALTGRARLTQFSREQTLRNQTPPGVAC